jgi:hypothetical protein
MLARLQQRPRLLNLGRWLGYLALSWLILRPALLITISLDDFINPFYVYDKYGSNPWHIASRATRDVFRNGHFNVIGQVFGAAVFASWNYLISWGVRYSLIYATTKFVVIVVCVLACARLLRTLAALVGRSFSPWRARVVVAAVLLPTLQLHVPWGFDPVGSFPLYGYLPAALGALAVDVAVRAVQPPVADLRRALLAAAALCGAILYYEINVAVVVALVPVVVVLALRLRRAGSSIAPLIRTTALVTVPPAVMTLVLVFVAKHTNQGYTGTDVEVGGTSVGLVARTVGGSLPASAWGAAHDWLGGSFGLTAWAAVSAVVIGVALCWATWAGGGGSATVDAAGSAVRRSEVGLVAASPVLVWLAATLIQTVTSKVNVDTVRIGYVYTYYAYGSVGIALAVILAVQALPGRAMWRRARPVLLAVALVFVVVQMSVNDTVTRAFDQRLAVNSRLLVAVSSRPDEAQRCDAERKWIAGTFYLPDYYHQFMVHGLDTTYQDHFGERFCDADVLAGG